MAETALVGPDVEKGKTLLRALDHEGLGVRSAYWQYTPGAGEWRLTFVMPIVDREGPQPAYSAVQRVLGKSGLDLPLRSITVLGSTDEFSQQLRRAVLTSARDVKDIRLTYTTVESAFVEDVYIYRSA